MTTPLHPPARCPVCALAPRSLYPLANGARLQQCPRCLLAWWRWPPFDPAAFYDQSYFQSPAATKGYDDYAALEPGLMRTARSRLRRIDRLAGLVRDTRQQPGHRNLLDIGCGTGAFLEVARRSGWDVRGVEVSAYAAEQARQRGLSVACEPIEHLTPPPATYDCVTLWDVLEHVRDPVRVLRAAGSALRSAGVLALSTGDITSLCARLSGRRWHLFNLPEHLYFFSPAALVRMLSRDFRLIRVTREANWLPTAYLLERIRKSLLRRAPWSRQLTSGLARSRIGRTTWPATLLDVIGVYAVRR